MLAVALFVNTVNIVNTSELWLVDFKYNRCQYFDTEDQWIYTEILPQ